MRVPKVLAAVVAAAALAVPLALAEPPKVTLPAEVPGEVSAFVVVRATVTGEAKGVKYKPIDPGLSVFPSCIVVEQRGCDQHPRCSHRNHPDERSGHGWFKLYATQFKIQRHHG